MKHDNDDAPVISPHLMTKVEIDDHIEQLKADLDSVGKKAKLALLQAEIRTKAIVSARNSD